MFFAVSLSSACLLPPEGISLPSKIASFNTLQIPLAFKKLKKQYAEDKSAFWWLLFKEAEVLKKTAPLIFCKNMKTLSEELKFPLRHLAGIYFYEDCALSESLAFHIQDFPDWLKPLAALSAYRRGKKSDNSKEVLNSALYLSEHSRYGELKVSYQRQALRLAIQLKDPREKEIQLRLFQLAPRFIFHPKPLDYLSMAHDLRKIRNFKKAAHYYIKVLNSVETSWEAKNQAFKWMAWIHKNQKNQKKLLRISQGWSRWLKTQKHKKAWKFYYTNQLEIARKYWNLDKNSEALALLDNLLKEPKSFVIKEKIHYLKGLIKVQQWLLDESLLEFDKALLVIEENSLIDAFSLQEKILWQKAWALRALNKPILSIKVFKKLRKASVNPYTRARALFWIGESLRELNRLFYANKTFRQLREEDPVGYYGLMACYRLNKEPLIFKSSSAFLSLEQMGLKEDELHLLYWLKSLKKTYLLEPFLESKKQALEDQGGKTFKDWMALILLYQATGRYLDLFQVFSLLPQPFQKLFIKDYNHLLFPLAFKEEVEREAHRQKVSSALLFALIRQESAFNRKARSPSDAFGLMQLIPLTARAVAKKIREPYRDYRELYRPKKNIRLGTAYFKQLLSQYNGSLILAAASYNAGSRPVKKWRSALDTSRPLDFIENIPYEETRTYVRLVIRNFVVYNKILKDIYKSSKSDTLSNLNLAKQKEKSLQADSLAPEVKASSFKEKMGGFVKKIPFVAGVSFADKKTEEREVQSYFPEDIFYID